MRRDIAERRGRGCAPREGLCAETLLSAEGGAVREEREGSAPREEKCALFIQTTVDLNRSNRSRISVELNRSEQSSWARISAHTASLAIFP